MNDIDPTQAPSQAENDASARVADLQAAKQVVLNYYAALDKAPGGKTLEAIKPHLSPELVWRGYHPFNELTGPASVATQFWDPLKKSMSPIQRRLDLFFAGRNEIDGYQSIWVASMGHLMGLFDENWLGIRPTHKLALLRYGAFHKIENGVITEEAMYFDIPHLMVQAGQNPFPPQTAAHLVQPGPRTHDGVMYEAQPEEVGIQTLAAINYMANDLKRWSGGKEEPLVDELRRSWNEDMLWWGPEGIGATYTIERYAKQHSGPFRKTFGVRDFHGHICRMAEGMYGGFFGWPNLSVQNKGGFMGMPAANEKAGMRVIDFYRREGDKLSENWIFIDMLHFYMQQGLDVLERNREIHPL